MRSVHLLGLGLVVGMLAMGAMLAAVAYRWQESSYSEQAPPGGVAQPPASAPGRGSSQEVAQGRSLFQQRCSSCHSIGGGKRVGPDLKGVTDRRAHDWLVEFIANPDQVIARNDPIAQELLKEYQTPMPNTGTTKAQAEDVLAYIRAESGGGAPVKSAPGAATPGPATKAGSPTPEVPVSPPASMKQPTIPPPSGTEAPAPTKPATAPGPAAGSTPAAGPAQQAATPGTATQPAQPAGQQPQPAGQQPPRAGQAAFQPKGDANKGKASFDQKCIGCHSIGGGRGAGPDLKGVTTQRPHEWLVEFIVAPDRVIGRGDPVAQQLVKEYGAPMPNLGVPAAEAEDMLAYIHQQSGGQAQPGAAPAPVTLGDASSGRALFTGQKRFGAGGPACAACHNVAGIGVLRGGTWGADLTNTFSKQGAEGLVAMVKNPPFPAMKNAYAANPASDAEVADLAAFFAEADKQQAPTSPDIAFPVISILAFTIMIGIALVALRGHTPCVRKPLAGGSGR